MTGNVLILGSAADAIDARAFDPHLFDAIVAINNAWRIRDDWTHLVHAGDFPIERMPINQSEKKIITYDSYVPANNAFGGIVYAGGTMAFTAAYWALHALGPNMMIFCGCDMVYDVSGVTHFYGKGTADPLREDPTLQSLEAKSNRLMALAAKHGTLCVNASLLSKSRLTFPRLNLASLNTDLSLFRNRAFSKVQSEANVAAIESALSLEAKAEQFISTGDYWNFKKSINPEILSGIDNKWLGAFRSNEQLSYRYN
jgi:hypothetical protein